MTISGMGETPPIPVEREPSSAEAQSAQSDAAQQFESLLVQQLWQAMRKTVSGAGFGGGGAGGDTYMHFMDEAVATQLTEGGGIGLRSVLEQSMGAPRHRTETSGLGIGPAALRQVERQAPVQLGPTTGQRVQGATGRLQSAARELITPTTASRWGRAGRLTSAELSSQFATERADGSAAVFNVRDAAGFTGEYKCNLFAFELVRRGGFQTPVVGRPHGWGYPSPDGVTADAADGRVRHDWGRVVTGATASELDEGITHGDRGFLLTGSGRDGHSGHMAVVERVHSVEYDDEGEVRQVVFDGWEARSTGARRLTSRTWNRYGTRGGNDARGGFDRIEIVELLAPRSGAVERPISGGAGPSRLDTVNPVPPAEETP